MARRTGDNGKEVVIVACKTRKVERHAPYLPREVIFNILLRIPAKDLHEVMRYVCKHWYDIVDDPLFIRVHHQMSPTGFFIQEDDCLLRAYYIDTHTARFNGTKIHIPYPAKVWGSLNGLVLLQYLTKTEVFHVMNPVTKVKISLPPLVGLKENFFGTGFGVTSSGRYKVMHAHVSPFDYTVEGLSVFTIGVDKAWRFIDIQGMLRNSQVEYIKPSNPWFSAGFIYWYSSKFFGFALDVDSEIIYPYVSPTSGGVLSWFVSTGSGIGALEQVDDDGICRFWKLVDVKSGTWTECARINKEAVRINVDKIFKSRGYHIVRPVKLIDEDLWFYRAVDLGYVVIRYNLANDSFAYFPIDDIAEWTLLHPHVHTLLSPENL